MSRIYQAEYFVNEYKVSLKFLKDEGYHCCILNTFKKLFYELKPYLFLPGSSVSTTFKVGPDRFTIKLYYMKGKYLNDVIC